MHDIGTWNIAAVKKNIEICVRFSGSAERGDGTKLALNQKVILFYYENWSENCG
jgi:hypothetical protein